MMSHCLRLLLVVVMGLSCMGAFAADAVMPSEVTANPESYVNLRVTVRGRVQDFSRNDGLSSRYRYNLADKDGALTVYTQKVAEDGDIKTVSGVVSIEGETSPYLVEESGSSVGSIVYIALGLAAACGVVALAVRARSRRAGDELAWMAIGSASGRPAKQPARQETPGVGGAALLPSGGGKAFPLPARSVKLGRGDACDLVVDHGTVSREHAKVIVDGGDYYVLDLGSRNGTYVNDERIDSLKLTPGDRIRLGDMALDFVRLQAKR